MKIFTDLWRLLFPKAGEERAFDLCSLVRDEKEDRSDPYKNLDLMHDHEMERLVKTLNDMSDMHYQ